VQLRHSTLPLSGSGYENRLLSWKFKKPCRLMAALPGHAVGAGCVGNSADG
jgi:hypothetical protein